MTVIDHLDAQARRIYLAAGVREYHPVQDIYREVRALRRTDESLRGFDCPVAAAGNVPKGGGKFTPRYAIFRDGWKIVPEDVSHTLFVTGEQLTDEGEAGPAAIDTSGLSAGTSVIVQYEPPAAEVIVIGGEEPDFSEIADAVLDKQIEELQGVPVIGATIRQVLAWMYMRSRNEEMAINDTNPRVTVANDSGMVIAEAPITDDQKVFTRKKYRNPQ